MSTDSRSTPDETPGVEPEAMWGGGSPASALPSLPPPRPRRRSPP